MGDSSLQRGLQGVVGGVGGAGDDVLGAKAADDVSRLVELGVGSEARARASVAVEEAHPRQLGGGRSNVGRVGYQVAEMAFQAESPGLKVGVAEAGIDAIDGQRSDQVGGRERGQILLVAIKSMTVLAGTALVPLAKMFCPLGV